MGFNPASSGLLRACHTLNPVAEMLKLPTHAKTVYGKDYIRKKCQRGTENT